MELYVRQTTSPDRATAILVSPQDVADAALATQVTFPGPTRIPPSYFVGTAERETNFASNECDVEPSGFTSKGLYQISDGWRHDLTPYRVDEDETRLAGMSGVNLYDFVAATTCFAVLQRQRLVAITHAAKLTMVPPPSDVWAYLGLAHNEGVNAAVKTITNHGLDWLKYKIRNGACGLHATRNDRWEERCNAGTCTPYAKHIGRYGDSCVTGGSRWHEVVLP